MRSLPAVLCVGAAHWDIIARADAATPPGDDRPGRVARRPGGVALNIAIALAAHGVPVALLAAIGRDAEGDALLVAAAARGVDVARAVRAASATDAYVAVEAAGELVAAVADCRTLEAAAPAMLSSLRAGPPGPTVLDGNLPAALFDAAAAERLFAGAPIWLTPASPAKADRLARFVAAVSPAVAANRAEAEALCDARFAAAEPAARALVALGASRAFVTDGPRAAALSGPDGSVARQPLRLVPASVTGAGDAALAALIAAERAGASDPSALLAAALDAAAVHVTCEAP